LVLMEFNFSRRQNIFILFIFMGPVLQAQQPKDSTAKADSLLLLQIQQSMQNENQNQTQQTRGSLSFNPDIGVIGDFRGSYISRGKRNFEAYLNETEISLQAAVDPYLRADF